MIETMGNISHLNYCRALQEWPVLNCVWFGLGWISGPGCYTMRKEEGSYKETGKVPQSRLLFHKESFTPRMVFRQLFWSSWSRLEVLSWSSSPTQELGGMWTDHWLAFLQSISFLPSHPKTLLFLSPARMKQPELEVGKTFSSPSHL